MVPGSPDYAKSTTKTAREADAHVTGITGALTENQIDHGEGEYVKAVDTEGIDEQHEVAVVPTSHTVSYPRTVMVEAIWSEKRHTGAGTDTHQNQRTTY